MYQDKAMLSCTKVGILPLWKILLSFSYFVYVICFFMENSTFFFPLTSLEAIERLANFPPDSYVYTTMTPTSTLGRQMVPFKHDEVLLQT